MISGAHFLLYTPDANADREFFREVLDLRAVDAGGGWLIFGLPSSEIAVHPDDGSFVQKQGPHTMAGIVLYLMTDDLGASLQALKAKRVRCTAPAKERWGSYSLIALPSGLKIGIYQPTHPTAIAPAKARRRTRGSART